MGLPRASRGSEMHVFLVIWAEEAPLLFDVVVYMQERVFDSFASNIIKLAVNETKWSTLLARTSALVLYISIWIFDFGPEKLLGLSINGPLTVSGDCVSRCRQIGSNSFVVLSKNERKQLQGVKRSSLCIAIGGFRSILFLFFHCVTVVVTTGFWIHIEKNSAIFTKFSFRKIGTIQEKTLACVKVAFRQNTYK